MNVVHRISIRPTVTQRKALQALGLTVPAGVALPGGAVPHVAFDVEESHPNWRALSKLFREWNVGDMVSTRFSVDELSAAGWLELVPEWHNGYPQPEEEFGYLEATYDLTDWCAACGAGLKQKAPFRMKGEPRWGRRGILQLNWVFDEFFVKPEVWSATFEPRGVAHRSVVNTKGVPLKTVVQLAVAEEVGIMTEGLDSEKCPNCGRVKYRPHSRGFFPALMSPPIGAIAKTKEVFGSGAAAHRRVLVSQELARAITGDCVRGVSLRPVVDS